MTKRTIVFIGVILGLVVFIKNAWVSEDAYILFRSVEQLFAGNGPNWNPHERLQAFTSPLWYGIIALSRIFSTDLYLNSVIVSFLLFIFCMFVLVQLFQDAWKFLVSVLLLVSSTAFFDFTSSGLENPLAYGLLLLYLKNYLELFSVRCTDSHRACEQGVIWKLFLVAGLLVTVRHGLVLLVLPSVGYIILRKKSVAKKNGWLWILLIFIGPILVWSVFSTIYYGFPFPNTAYAKLNTGINHVVLMMQGGVYFLSSLVFDSVTLYMIFSVLLLSFMKGWKASSRWLLYGVILNLAYILCIGGDFMQGRFFSYSYLVCTVVFLSEYQYSWKFSYLAVIVLLLYSIAYQHTPLNSPVEYKNTFFYSGIADERGYYFRELSFVRYIRSRLNEHIHPDHFLAGKGREFAKTDELVGINKNVGLFGYCAGTDKIIIDPRALTDPLLARLPVRGNWRVGHYTRKIPEGYIESIRKDKEMLKDRKMNEFYRKLKKITCGNDLFSVERLETIIKMNAGYYDHLLEHL